jgi:hypothetical protein
MLTNCIEIDKEETLNFQSTQANKNLFQEEIGEYVAHLQLHMALQARNLVPTLNQVGDSREQFLQETQANIEKLVSRQF